MSALGTSAFLRALAKHRVAIASVAASSADCSSLLSTAACRHCSRTLLAAHFAKCGDRDGMPCCGINRVVHV
jgi:hypothetical protein